jgi:hypothetical protein
MDIVQVAVNMIGVFAVGVFGYMLGWWNRGRIDRQRYGLDMIEGVHVVHP